MAVPSPLRAKTKAEMSTDQHKALVRKYVEHINNQDLEAAFAAFSLDFVDHALRPGIGKGIDGMRHFFTMQFAAFPDMHTTVGDLIAEGDMVAAHMTVHGTNSGSFMGMPPTGKSAIWSFVDIFRIKDGELIEHWVEMDTIALLRQLDMVPPLA